MKCYLEVIPLSAINIINSQVIFTDNNQQNQILLDMHHFLNNKSRIPMHSIQENGPTILRFLSDLIQKNETTIANLTPIKKLQYITLDTLLIAELIKSAAPVKVAEFGCTYGELSYNLTEVIGKFHPNSFLCLISNTIGNNSSNTCLDFITQAESFPELSMVYSDYVKTNLADNTFDFVIINGDISYENPYDVIKEAERITKKNGTIFCCSCENHLLNSTFQLIFSERKEYTLTPADVIITTEKIDNSWEHKYADNYFSELSTLIASLKDEVNTQNRTDIYKKYIKQLDKCIDIAIAQYNIEVKLMLIQIKENLLDYINYSNTIHKNFYQNKLLSSISNIGY